MTKDLSKQICEKCGIKPFSYRYKVKSAKTSLELEVSKKWIEITFWHGNNLSFKVIEVIKKYRDFAQPENFTTLIELQYLNSTLLDYIKEYPIKDRKTFLEKLLYELDNNEELKQLIRKTEWKYE